ncbi:uncharacterized protein LOC133892823 [Phragmites australis]|uniref:uncharacterized protein LOC133892823 n=1 Tax=Phragmites australis TaxID=29695 RepID=UPI002D79EC86|nr:uncharacterized protein LOC133892823 [Phragmites australis]
MKTKAANNNKATADEDEAKPKKIRSSRSKHRRSRSPSGSESPPRKRSKKHSKRIPHKKSKRSKVSSSSHRRRRRSLSPSRSLSSSNPSSVAHRSCSTCSSNSSASERSVSLPPRSRSRDVRKKRGRGRDRERDRKRRKARRSSSDSSSEPSCGSSRSRSRSGSKSKSRKRRVGDTKEGAGSDKIEKDYNSRHTSRSEKSMIDDDDRVEDPSAKKGDNDIDIYEKSGVLEKMESLPSKNANETEEILPAGGGNSDAEDLELILRQKALENFRKFRAAAVMAVKTDNGATGKEALMDSPQNTSTKIAEARSAAGTPFQRQGSSLGVRHSAGSPRSEDHEYGMTHSWKQESSAGMSRGDGSPGILEAGDTCGPTQQKGSTVEATHSTSQIISPQYSRNDHSVMHRLVSIPGSSASVKQRLGSNAGMNGTPRVRSVVRVPAREGLDGSTYSTPPRTCENSAPFESSSEVGCPLIDINKAEGTNGDDRKASEASASNGSILSPAVGKSQARIEDKDGSQFQKKTFSRMHDGETVEVSYKVYIPKKTPALARRKFQR